MCCRRKFRHFLHCSQRNRSHSKIKLSQFTSVSELMRYVIDKIVTPHGAVPKENLSWSYHDVCGNAFFLTTFKEYFDSHKIREGDSRCNINILLEHAKQITVMYIP